MSPLSLSLFLAQIIRLSLKDLCPLLSLRVVTHNTSPNVTKIRNPVYQNLDFFLTALACSVDFLSVIFGFSMKFHVDIGGRKIFLGFFSKKNLSKSRQKIFFGKFLKFSRNSLRVWRIPFISLIKGISQTLKEF